jgi:hypothetical protein
VGKTRLALEVASDAAGSFPNGVAFVALAPVGDVGLVASAVARALGLRETGGAPPLETVRAYLGGREMLLVLNNFEHVAEATPKVVDLVGSCPNLTVLVTSRAPLRVRGERENLVPPLAAPDPNRAPGAAEVAASPAAQLFVKRAREASPSFSLTGRNAAAVAAICWQLDGLPLALELAAAQARFLGPTELLSRLDEALQAGGRETCPSAKGRCGRRWTGATVCCPARRRRCFGGSRCSPAASRWRGRRRWRRGRGARSPLSAGWWSSRWWQRRSRLRENTGADVSWATWRDLNERDLAAARENLDVETFDAARAEGRAMTFEEAVAEALAEDA